MHGDKLKTSGVCHNISDPKETHYHLHSFSGALASAVDWGVVLFLADLHDRRQDGKLSYGVDQIQMFKLIESPELGCLGCLLLFISFFKLI